MKASGMAFVLLGAGAIALRAQEEPLLNSDPAILHSVVEAERPDMPRADSATVVELKDGSLMVFYQRFQGGGSAHDMALSRVWTRVSRDGGRTWIEPRLLVDNAPGDINVGMPAILRLPSGELLLALVRLHNPSSTTMGTYRSTDEGRTFLEGPPVWSHSDGMLNQGGTPLLLLLASGRIAVPVSYGPPGGDTRKMGCTVFVSDDSGRTWRQTPTRLTLPRRGADEPSLAELDGGLLVMSIRTQLGGPYLSRSRDGGETWSAPEPAGWTPTGGTPLMGTESCICLRRIPGTNSLLIIWNNAEYHQNRDHSGARTPLTAAVSANAGDDWTIVGDLAGGKNFELTNPNCSFTSKGEAVVTYMGAYLSEPWPSRSERKFSLRAAVIEPSWFKPALAAASVPKHRVYHIPGSDSPSP